MIQTYQNNCSTYWFQNSPQCSEPNNVDGMCNERDTAASRLLLAQQSHRIAEVGKNALASTARESVPLQSETLYAQSIGQSVCLAK